MRNIFLIIIILLLLPLTINFLVSLYSGGIEEVAVPPLIGLSTPEALAILQALNLSGKVVGKTYSKIPENNIVYQQPEADIKVKEGRTINLIISQGRRIVIVPNLIGRPMAGMKEYLIELGLVLGNVSEINNSIYEKGIIVDQSLPPKEEVPYGTLLDIIISK